MVRRSLLALVATLGLGSCTLVVGSLSDCSKDSDCAAKGAGLLCASGICVEAVGTDGGHPDAGSPDAGSPDAGHPDGGHSDGGVPDAGPGDAGCEGPDDCFLCAPSTFVQYLNACTDSSDMCTAFANSRVGLLEPDGGLPTVPPDDAGPPPDAGHPVDAGHEEDAGHPDAGHVVEDAGSPLPSCDPGNGNPVVYVTGSTAAQPFLAALSLALFNDTTDGAMTLVYQGSGSCVGVGDVLNALPMTGTASYWNPAVNVSTGNQVTCALPKLDGGIIPDLGVSDVFPETCTPLSNGLPATVGEFFGPVQTMTFVVPSASSQQSISAAAAYSVLGFGSGSEVSPWTNGSDLFRRNSSSGTQSMIAVATGVSVDRFKGIDASSTNGVISKVANSSDPEATLGILTDTAITGMVVQELRVLAYQHYDQDCGYLPDSNGSSHDKRNVRDGHYAIWGPIHFLATIDPTTGYVRNANAKRVVDYVTGTTAPPGSLNLVSVEAQNNLVPTCAMQVTRTTEMGPYASTQPTYPCGCEFDLVATGSTTCTACTSPTQCPASAPQCSYGYCEP